MPPAPAPSDPRVFFAAERTLLAWQRTSIALMGFGFLIERFSRFLAVRRQQPESAPRHLLSLSIGVVLIVMGAAVSLASSLSFRRFVRQLPVNDVPPGSWAPLGIGVNLVLAALGALLAIYLVGTAI